MSDPDAGLAERIAECLRRDRQRELADRANPPPQRPAAPVPDWLFGPRHRELDAKRMAERAPVQVVEPTRKPCGAWSWDDKAIEIGEWRGIVGPTGWCVWSRGGRGGSHRGPETGDAGRLAVEDEIARRLRADLAVLGVVAP